LRERERERERERQPKLNLAFFFLKKNRAAQNLLPDPPIDFRERFQVKFLGNLKLRAVAGRPLSNQRRKLHTVIRPSSVFVQI
jgi:hypothetical protein